MFLCLPYYDFLCLGCCWRFGNFNWHQLTCFAWFIPRLMSNDKPWTFWWAIQTGCLKIGTPKWSRMECLILTTVKTAIYIIYSGNFWDIPCFPANPNSFCIHPRTKWRSGDEQVTAWVETRAPTSGMTANHLRRPLQERWHELEDEGVFSTATYWMIMLFQGDHEWSWISVEDHFLVHSWIYNMIHDLMCSISFNMFHPISNDVCSWISADLRFQVETTSQLNSIAVSLPEGWVLQVNKCLPDQIDSDEAIPPSGSERERTSKVPVLHGSDVSTAATAATTTTTATKEVEPCLFHSYTARCAKGQHCEYSHAIHADQVILPQQHKRGKARQKIRTEVQRC